MTKIQRISNIIVAFFAVAAIFLIVFAVLVAQRSDAGKEKQVQIREAQIYTICVKGLSVLTSKDGTMYERTIDDKLVACK